MKNTRDSELATVALLYYGEGLTQSEIAKRLGVSRVTVVNQLREARKRGIVDIRIDGQALAVSDISRRLCAQYGLEDAYIAFGAPANGARKRFQALDATARVAAMAVLDLTKPGDMLGVSWGGTVRALADQLPNRPIENVSVCQVVGSMNSDQLPAPEICAIRIANRLGAHCYTLHAPAVTSTAKIATLIRNEPTIREQLDRLDRLDSIVFSIGELSPETQLVTSGIETVEGLRVAQSKGARGIVCGRYFDQAARHLATPLDDRLIAMTVDQLRSVTKRLLVTCGRSKREATAVALEGGLATHACMDEDTAEWLVSRRTSSDT